MISWEARFTRTVSARNRPSAKTIWLLCAPLQAMRWNIAAARWKQPLSVSAVTSLMTGSGAAVFGVFDDGQKAKQAQQALQAGYDQVYLARPVRGGARVLPRPAKKDHTPRREK